MKSLLFSVVIPTYNRKRLLGACLEALERQDGMAGAFEVIVVVDGSDDGTIKELEAKWVRPWLRWMNVIRGGASAARNAGVGSSRGYFIAFTEDDVLPDPRWLSAALEVLESSGADVLEGNTVYPGDGAPVRKMEPAGILSFVPCNLFVRRSLFESVGGYDPAFFDAARNLYFREDADLGFRLLDAGAVTVQSDRVTVVHPRQFQTVGECLHHARRYEFDALLYRRHPRRYREMIEVKEFRGILFRRPQHWIALLYGVALAAVPVFWLAGMTPWAWAASGVLLLCSFLFRVKYHGRGALRLYRLKETAGFLILPAVYLWAILRGAIRYRAAGVLR